MDGRRYTAKIFLFFVLFLSFMVSARGAKSKGIVVYGTYQIDAGATSGTRLTLFQNGTKQKNNVTGDGNFRYNLSFNKQYELVFAKDGYITKKVYVSTDVPERVLKSNNEFPPFKIEITLYKKVKGGDYSIFDEPVAMVIYDKELDDFDFDKAYNVEVKEKIEEIEAQLAVATVDTKLNTPPDNSIAYSKKIEEADALFEKKSYEAAQKSYQEAIKIAPKESYPKTRLKIIRKELLALAEQKRNEQEQKQKDESFARKIKEADAFFASQEYDKAKLTYKIAKKIKPDESYPDIQMKKIEELISQNKKTEQDYKRKLTLADRSFKRKKYEEAKKIYEEALSIKKGEKYPLEQLAKIEESLVEKEKDLQQNIAYDDAISKADSLFELKNWENSKEFYVLALKVKPQKKYPNYKLAEVEDRLQRKREEENKKTREKEEDEMSVKVVDVKNEDTSLIENSINKGDQAFVKKDWTQARVHYFEALKKKPDHKYLNNRIAIVDKQIAKGKIKEENADRKQSLIEENVKKGEYALKKKNYRRAKTFYNRAFQIDPDSEDIKNKLVDLEKLIVQQEEKEKKYYTRIEVASSKQEKYCTPVKVLENSQQKRYVNLLNTNSLYDAKYNKLIKKAEDALNKKNYTFAKSFYQQAYNVKPSPVLLAKIKELVDKM